MDAEAGREFTKAIDAMAIIIPALMDWADTRLEGNERHEMLYHVKILLDDFRKMMAAVADYSGVEIE